MHPPPSPPSRIATPSRSRDNEVGKAEFIDRGNQRVFTHTEVDDNYEGRGLATILIGEALQETRDAGLRIVAKCPMVANYVAKHDEFKDVVDN